MKEVTLLTVEGLRDKVNTARQSSMPLEQLWEYGKDQRLQFVVVSNNREAFKLQEAWKQDPRTLYAVYLPISHHQLINILGSSTPARIALVEMLVDGHASQLVPVPYVKCGVESLRVTSDEADRFIAKLAGQDEEQPKEEARPRSETDKKRFEYIEQFLSRIGAEDISNHSLKTLLDIFNKEQPSLFRTLSERSLGNLLGKYRKRGLPFPKLKRGS